MAANILIFGIQTALVLNQKWRKLHSQPKIESIVDNLIAGLEVAIYPAHWE